MTETPVPSPPFPYSIPTDTFDPVQEGVGIGCFTSFILSLLYPPTLLIINGLTQVVPIMPSDMRNFGELTRDIVSIYGGSLLFFIVVFIMGGIPAMILGAVGGGIIGATFRYVVKRQLSFYHAMQYGFWLSFFFLILRIVAGARIIEEDTFLNSPTPLNDLVAWVVWYIPNLIAFFGFWWITCNVNSKMPTS